MSDNEAQELRDRGSVLWNALCECNALLHDQVESLPRNAIGNEFLRTKVDYFNYILWKGGFDDPYCLRRFKEETEKLLKRRAQYDKAREDRVWLTPAQHAAIKETGDD